MWFRRLRGHAEVYMPHHRILRFRAGEAHRPDGRLLSATLCLASLNAHTHSHAEKGYLSSGSTPRVCDELI